MSHDDDWDDETKAVPAAPAAEDPGATASEAAYLIVLSGSRMGSMIEVRDGLVIGRAHTTDFQVPDEGISRQHVRIRATPDGKLTAEDLGSMNGMFVNGHRVAHTVLTDGDKIRIGTTTILKFSYADKLEESFQLQLREAALRDPLTRVYNRRFLDEHLAREVAFARRHGSPLSLILIDIDHFKEVNDTHGHLVGDAVLMGLAGAVSKQIRQEDFLARYGGEEFAVVCRGTTGVVAFAVADRLRMRVQTQALIPERPGLWVTFSAGVAAMPDPELPGERELIDAADRALYRAKHGGRNRVHLHRAGEE